VRQRVRLGEKESAYSAGQAALLGVGHTCGSLLQTPGLLGGCSATMKCQHHRAGYGKRYTLSDKWPEEDTIGPFRLK